jgi:hypothetical protein
MPSTSLKSHLEERTSEQRDPGNEIRRLRLELKGHIPLVFSVGLLFPSAVARSRVLDVEIQSSLSF